MSRIELLSSGGLRHDNRRPYEMRQLDFTILSNPPLGSDAAAKVSHGLTRVIAFVCGPREGTGVGRGPSGGANGAIAVHVGAAPFSGPERKKVGKTDKKLSDVAYSIQNTFEPVVMLQLYPRSVIEIYIEVLQHDGGLLQAAINATSLALIAAGISITDYVVAVSVASLSTPYVPLLDISNTEQSDLPHLTVATLPRSQKVTLVQLEARLNIETFEAILKVGVEACSVLTTEMDREVRRWSTGLNSRMVGSIAAEITGSDRPSQKPIGTVKEEMDLD
ncbi:hypothetical protein CROQUDRAFT_134963 [Cronartium quercuum f. sp. fusiforme G11]|uniref:Ribosomal RNA-processing protein 41 n=1 Tax=Cronartium quercuum f. sp. fusiforme G11 TaxID=708437 RepID=A0A9P6NBD1_9BASI|nr:hypothetical protein CROQUDRAFT_134963 [Cronartium quercuum f. sp. fusiforme G11]